MNSAAKNPNQILYMRCQPLLMFTLKMVNLLWARIHFEAAWKAAEAAEIEHNICYMGQAKRLASQIERDHREQSNNK
jgi:hypothetical protein